MAKVAVVMGSKSDLGTVMPCIKTLKDWGLETEVRVLSAHRTPAETHEFAAGAIGRGVDIIVAAAGKAAHLAGVVAACTTLPVIGIPILGSATAGLDSLLSTVQMPAGIPVATVAVNGAENAALLAIRMIALKDRGLAEKLIAHQREMAATVLAADAALQTELAE